MPSGSFSMCVVGVAPVGRCQVLPIFRSAVFSWAPAIEMHAKVNIYHLSLFAQFVERLKATEDGDGSLLDHSLIVYGSGMGNGNVHSPEQLPTLLVGSGAGAVKGNRHIVAGTLTPNADLLLSIAETYGIELQEFGDSKGRISL